MIKKDSPESFLLTLNSESIIISKTIYGDDIMGESLFFMFLGAVIGFIYLNYMLSQGLKKLQEDDEIVDRALKIWKENMIPLQIEKVKDVFYAYNDETGVFVCQGATFDELQDNFRLRFPDNGSYIKEKYMHFFPEELKKAKQAQKKAHNKILANLDTPKNDIVIIDDRKQNKE